MISQVILFPVFSPCFRVSSHLSSLIRQKDRLSLPVKSLRFPVCRLLSSRYFFQKERFLLNLSRKSSGRHTFILTHLFDSHFSSYFLSFVLDFDRCAFFFVLFIVIQMAIILKGGDWLQTKIISSSHPSFSSSSSLSSVLVLIISVKIGLCTLCWCE